MAKEIASLKEWEKKNGEDFMAYMDRIDVIWEEIVKSGKSYSSCVADGKACYEIVSEKPLILRHVPVCDGYRINPAMMRGLRMSDIKQQRAWYATFHN